MTEDVHALIEQRLKQADESLEEAKVLLKEKMSLRAVMNRLYYAMFYATLALLLEKQLGTSKHIGVITLFDKEFIKTGIFDKELSKILHRAFELRQKGDYMEEADVAQQDVDEILPQAMNFISQIKKYLEGKVNW